MRISHNITALNTYRQYNINTVATNKSMEKLSSGSRINRAADDAAGLSISEKMRAQIRGLTQANRNAQDGVSFIQTAEGALSEVSDMLTRMKELTTQVANGTYSVEDQKNIGSEMKALGKAITDIYVNTKFNGSQVFGKNQGTYDATVAATYEDGTGVETMGQIIGALKSNPAPPAPPTPRPSSATARTAARRSTPAGRDREAGGPHLKDGSGRQEVESSDGFDGAELISELGVAADSSRALLVTDKMVEDAISEVDTTRATYGARRTSSSTPPTTWPPPRRTCRRRVPRPRRGHGDEMMNYTKNNILLQASQAMLAQANAQPQGILQLLQ